MLHIKTARNQPCRLLGVRWLCNSLCATGHLQHPGCRTGRCEPPDGPLLVYVQRLSSLAVDTRVYDPLHAI